MDDLATRVKELPRKAHVEPDCQEEEALAALKRAQPDTMAQTIVIHLYATVDECSKHLAELEALQEEKDLQNFCSLSLSIRRQAC